MRENANVWAGKDSLDWTESNGDDRGNNNASKTCFGNLADQHTSNNHRNIVQAKAP